MCQNWRSLVLAVPEAEGAPRAAIKIKARMSDYCQYSVRVTSQLSGLELVQRLQLKVESWPRPLAGPFLQRRSAALCANEGVVFSSYDAVAASVPLHVHSACSPSIRVIFSTHGSPLLIVLLSSKACLFLRRRQKMLFCGIFVPPHTYQQIFIPSRAELTIKIQNNYHWH